MNVIQKITVEIEPGYHYHDQTWILVQVKIAGHDPIWKRMHFPADDFMSAFEWYMQVAAKEIVQVVKSMNEEKFPQRPRRLLEGGRYG